MHENAKRRCGTAPLVPAAARRAFCAQLVARSGVGIRGKVLGLAVWRLESTVDPHNRPPDIRARVIETPSRSQRYHLVR